ncbi:unnamed protein product [Echinostoma caproni]|uniref:HP domain-containing protein n=1 Tax=Echinostoma caproni TaxID=27848 RepID=A0A183ACE8_9TREM|nr:unnamed protein product [Echinostoma caproni]
MVDCGRTCLRIAEVRRAARPERRKPSRTPNPLKSLAQRTDLRSEYEEIRSKSVTLCTPTPSHKLLRTIDPSNRLSFGRRKVQVRLVAPSAESMNSGDCFVLVTSSAVFAWFGALANIVEMNKARGLAHWIHIHHELGYRGSGSLDIVPGDSDSYIGVYEQLQDDDDLTTMDIVEAGLTKKRRDITDPATIKFWESLGYDSPQSVQACGSAEEDEMYETLMQHTNRVYEVTVDQLVPVTDCWGTSIKKSLLRTDKAFVFDFGSEVYLWTGTQVSPEVRLAGVELVQQAYSAPYDYSHCRLNPLNPLSIDFIMETALASSEDSGFNFLPGSRLFDLEYADDILLLSKDPAELALELRHVIEVTQTEDKLGPGELIFLLNTEDNASSPLCLQPNPNPDQLVIWHLSSQTGSTIQTRRLSYTLQPDPSMVTGNGSPGKLPSVNSRQTRDQETNGPELEALAIAKAVAERLRASNDAANAQLKHSIAQSGFPFLLSELYSANQPALLFLVLNGRQAVYLWQGWWPTKRRSLDTNGSFVLRSPNGSRSSFYSTISSTSSIGDRGDIGSQTDDSIEALSPGSARSRFYALRFAALKTANALATKRNVSSPVSMNMDRQIKPQATLDSHACRRLGVRAAVVYAGLEPCEFLALFPPHIRLPEVIAHYQPEEGKLVGQMDNVNDLLASSQQQSYTLYELQQRPLPPELNATCLEIYLDKESFENAFAMTKEEFDQLPKWKKAEMKKHLGLF